MFSKKSDEKNPYEVLGFADPNSEVVDMPGLGVLSKDSRKADEQIKNAYRDLIREIHPDKNRDDPEG